MHIDNQQLLAQLRKRGLTSEGLAEEADLGQQTIRDIERGKKLRAKDVKKLARALRTSTDSLTDSFEPSKSSGLGKTPTRWTHGLKAPRGRR